MSSLNWYIIEFNVLWTKTRRKLPI